MDEEALKRITANLADLKKRLEAGDSSALEKLHDFGKTPEEAIKKLTELLQTLLENRVQLAKHEQDLKEKIEHYDRMAELKETYSLTPDFADIRLRFIAILDHREMGYGTTMAKWVHDHMEFYVAGWPTDYKNWLMFMLTLNHEVMHGVIGKVLLEDGLIENHVHFPFLAGMDEMLGVCTAHTNREMYMPMREFLEESHAFGNTDFDSLRKLIRDSGMDIW